MAITGRNPKAKMLRRFYIASFTDRRTDGSRASEHRFDLFTKTKSADIIETAEGAAMKITLKAGTIHEEQVSSSDLLWQMATTLKGEN